MGITENTWRDLDGSEVQNNSRVLYITDTGECDEATVAALLDENKVYLKVKDTPKLLIRDASEIQLIP